MSTEKVMEDLFPIMDIEHDCILSKRGDISVVFKVTLPEIFTQSDANYEAIHQGFIKAIKILSAGTVFHKQDYFIASKYQPDFETLEKGFLSRSSDLYFNERPYLKHDCFIILTKIAEDRKPASSVLSTLLQPTLVPKSILDPLALSSFEDSCGQFARILGDTGIQLERLCEKDLCSHKGESGLIERYCTLSEDKQERILYDMELMDSFKIGNKNCQLFTLSDITDLPSVCGSRINYDKYSTDRTKFSIGFASTLGLLLPCSHIYNQYIIIGDTPKTIKKLESKRLRLQSLAAYSRENAIAKDAVGDFLNEYVSEQRLPVKAHFNVLVWSEHPEELKEIKNLVTSAMAQMDASTKLETAGAAQIWWAGFPGNAADIPQNETFDTFAEQACCFLNLETNYESSISPVGIRLGDRLTGRPVDVDISDEPITKGITNNRNKFILAPSGGGKSFFCNHFLRSYYEQGSHIVLVDVGHSYKGLCDLVDGYYFTYSENDPIRFNPFYIGEGDNFDIEKKESIKTLLLAIWKKDDENYSRSEYVALSNALNGYFDSLEKNKDIFPCFNTFYEYIQTDFVEIVRKDKVKERHFDLDNFLFVLRPYYKGGEFDFLLNANKNLELLQQRFIVFELDNIKDSILFPVVTLIIMEVFISKMRKLKGIRKIILIEEAWKALMKDGFAEYIKYLFKTVRKFFGEAIVVTQDIEDLISSPIVKQTIINNSDFKILLDQSKYQNRFDQIQDLLGLDEKNKQLALSLNKSNDPNIKYKEVLIIPLSKVYRVEVSMEEYLAYTTEEREKVKVQEYAKKYGSIELGIKRLAEELKSKK